MIGHKTVEYHVETVFLRDRPEYIYTEIHVTRVFEKRFSRVRVGRYYVILAPDIFRPRQTVLSRSDIHGYQ